MATKVDQIPTVEPHHAQTAGMISSSASSASSPKISMFGAKSGFVIPKNKLSGSLVPIARGGGKTQGSDVTKEENLKRVQRKTKWGADLTQDAAVRKGRALAYQTRVEQITQQLKLGILEAGDDQGSLQSAEVPNEQSSSELTSEENSLLQKSEQLELERREAIGEILKLNPSYKAPPDYKPLLKEAKVPIPIKAFPGYNFIGLILGPGSKTQKRLEEETGAKICVHGSKAGSGEKGEITLLDGNEIQADYEDLYVHVSADTFEKVDAAVALIELLVTPVPGNSAVVSTTPTSVPGADVNSFSQSQNTASGYMMPITVFNQGVVQPRMPAQSGPPQGQYQPLYPNPWFQVGPYHAPFRPPTGFIPPPNSSASVLPSNPIRFPQLPLSASNMPPIFGGHPPSSAGFGSVPGNPSVFVPRTQPSAQVLQQPYMPEVQPPSHVGPRMNHLIHSSRPQSPYTVMAIQPNPRLLPPLTGSQSTTTGPPPVVGSQVPSFPYAASNVTSGPLPMRPLTPAGSSAGWSSAPSATPASIGLGSMPQMASQTASPQMSHPPLLQPTFTSLLPSPMSAPLLSRPAATNMVSPISPVLFPSNPSAPRFPNTVNNRPAVSPAFSGPGILPLTASMPQTPVAGPAVAPALPSLPSAVHSAASGPVPAPSAVAAPTLAPSPLLPRAPSAISGVATGTAPASAPAPIISSSVAPIQQVMPTTPIPGPHPNPALGSASITPPAPSTSPQPQLGMPNTLSGSLQSFTPVRPPLVTASKPHRPSSGDFTFQPHRPQNAASQMNPGQSVAQNTLTVMPKPTVPLPVAPQAPSFRPAMNNLPSESGTQRPAMNNLAPQAGMQHFLPRISGQTGQPQAPPPPPSPGSIVPIVANSAAIKPPIRHPGYPSQHPIASNKPVPQIGQGRFGSAPQMPNIVGLPPRPANPRQMLQNQSSSLRPGNPLVQNHQYGNNISFASGKPASSPRAQQVYDPFSPTSGSSAPPQVDNTAKVRKQENDPEYEDLMASVGVR